MKKQINNNYIVFKDGTIYSLLSKKVLSPTTTGMGYKQVTVEVFNK